MPAENKTGIKTKYIQAHILSLGVFLRYFFFKSLSMWNDVAYDLYTAHGTHIGHILT